MKFLKKNWLQILRYCFLTLFLFISFKKLPFAGVILLVSTILGGAFHCGWICPAGFLQDIGGIIARTLKIKQKNLLPTKYHRIAVVIRYLIFAGLIGGITWVSTSIDTADFRRVLMAILRGRTVATIGIVSFIVFFVLSIFYKRVFCSYFCYEGAKYGIQSAFRLFTIKRNPNTCVNCKKCDSVCPMAIDISNSHNLQSLQCVNCFQCISTCPVKNTLTYGLINPVDDPIGERLQNINSLKKILIISVRILLVVGLFLCFYIK